ncbi:RagB/SusD family nutrient uptake outer membrane protein [Lacibacter sp. H375]|uniref:RagB/SusD family nutrient uptake outer membrane protein n=1 Tax=Lacibacter sp. H375 TaxID=3133424 RepID=UPI0030C2A1F5
MKKRYIIIAGLLIATVYSCTKILDQAPKGSLNTETLKNKEGAEALVIACYSILDNKDPQPSWGWGNVGSNLLNNASMWESGDLRSDDCYKGGGGTDDVSEYGQIELGILQTTNAAFQVIWKGHYVSISRCNKALQLLNQLTDAEFPLRQRRIAEVKVLRGFYYMRLKQLFRTFPYIDETVVTGQEGEVANNLTEAQLWEKIVADFNAGITIPFDGQDAGRVNKYVAYSFIAKAEMFRKNYAAAITAADQVISSGKYQLLNNLEGLYSDPALERAGENIFAIEASVGGGAESNVRFNWGDIWVAPSNGPYGGGDGFQRPSQNLVNAFKVDANGLPLHDTYNNSDLPAADIATPVDPRLDHAIGRPGIRWKDYTNSPQTIGWARAEGTYGPYVKKKNLIYVNSPFRATASTDFPWAGGALNLPFLKYSEILLIKAEALVELNQNLDLARTLINQLRTRAANTPKVKSFSNPAINAANYQIGLYPATGWTQDYARKAVRFERRLELCLEGLRYFDLLRWGVAKQVIDAYNNTEKTKRVYLGAATFNAPKVEYYPIPQAEIDISRGKLKQDPNY